MPTVFDVANYFLARNDPSEGDRITPLKLQKLVYYAQGYALALLGRPLFEESISAWRLGPVCSELYRHFKSFGNQPIDKVFGAAEEAHEALREAQKPFAREEVNFLNDIFACYGGYTAITLSHKAHETPPWKEAPHNSVISHEAMKRYFEESLADVKVEILPLTIEEADRIAAMC